MIHTRLRQFAFTSAAYVATLVVAAACHAQIGQSSIVVKLDEFTIGLGGATHVSPTDLVPLNDASGRMAVATINGVRG